MKAQNYIMFFISIFCFMACQDDPINVTTDLDPEIINSIPGLAEEYEYAQQDIPNYIDADNTRGNEITNAGATLGRVLFYDKKLSFDNTISCASCHKQNLAFGDDNKLSPGVNGETGRHSMRLINARFSEERKFFWDERANNLEQQTTMPIKDHIEMGFSGIAGEPSIDDLIEKLSSEIYYQQLFTNAFGDNLVSENRMQDALAQFVRSIQSFDSKYDAGRAMVNDANQSFPNFTSLENEGKNLFSSRVRFQGNSGIRIGGGLGCQPCHRSGEFDIAPNSRNNGVITSADGTIDESITRAPTLRDIFNSNGELNGPLMHNGEFSSFEMVLEHYNDIEENGNNNLDNRLSRGNGQKLNMTENEKLAVIAFIKTLSGTDVYQNKKWSNPFDF